MIPAADFVAAAKDLLGTRWLRRGRSPGGVDCSGLCILAARNSGVDLRDYAGQYDSLHPDPKVIIETALKSGEFISPRDAEPGMLFLAEIEGMKGATHLGIYVSKDRVIHMDPHKRKAVMCRPSALRGRIVAAIKLNGVEY